MRRRMKLLLAAIVLLGCAATAMTVARNPEPLSFWERYQLGDHTLLGYPPPRDSSDDGDSSWCQEAVGYGPLGQIGCD